MDCNFNHYLPSSYAPIDFYIGDKNPVQCKDAVVLVDIVYSRNSIDNDCLFTHIQKNTHRRVRKHLKQDVNIRGDIISLQSEVTPSQPIFCH